MFSSCRVGILNSTLIEPILTFFVSLKGGTSFAFSNESFKETTSPSSIFILSPKDSTLKASNAGILSKVNKVSLSTFSIINSFTALVNCNAPRTPLTAVDMISFCCFCCYGNRVDNSS